MRKHLQRRALAEVVRQNGPQVMGNANESPEALDLWVKTRGAAAAAWLIWQKRYEFLQYGEIRFFLKGKPKPPELQPYMRVAFETLRRRTASWEVRVERKPFETSYYVKWKGWKKNVPRAKLS